MINQTCLDLMREIFIKSNEVNMKKIFRLVFTTIILITFLFSSFTAYAKSASGIDVSHNNSVPDYASMKQSGREFVMIRLGYFTTLDKKFLDNVNAAVEAGMEYGVYLYSYAENSEEAAQEAQFVASTLNSLTDEQKSLLTYPVAYDLEDAKVQVLGKKQITRQAVLFCKKIENSGFVPMVYANNYWFTTLFDISAIKACGWKLWYARFVENPDFSTPVRIGDTDYTADMWQYQRGDTTDDGFDLNVAFDEDDIKHIYVSTSNIVEPTLKRPGSVALKCRICGKTKTQKIPRLKAPPVTWITSLKADKNAVTVKWKKRSCCGYRVQYALNKSFTKGRKTLALSANSKSFKKLKSKKKYYFRVSTFKTYNGKKYYSEWSVVKSIVTK